METLIKDITPLRIITNLLDFSNSYKYYELEKTAIPNIHPKFRLIGPIHECKSSELILDCGRDQICEIAPKIHPIIDYRDTVLSLIKKQISKHDHAIEDFNMVTNDQFAAFIKERKINPFSFATPIKTEDVLVKIEVHISILRKYFTNSTYLQYSSQIDREPCYDCVKCNNTNGCDKCTYKIPMYMGAFVIKDEKIKMCNIVRVRANRNKVGLFDLFYEYNDKVKLLGQIHNYVNDFNKSDYKYTKSESDFQSLVKKVSKISQIDPIYGDNYLSMSLNVNIIIILIVYIDDQYNDNIYKYEINNTTTSSNDKMKLRNYINRSFGCQIDMKELLNLVDACHGSHNIVTRALGVYRKN